MAQTTLKSPYEVLGVAKTASAAQIKKAYRKLAKELHPDQTGNDPAKAERFKEVAAAYDLLGDTEKRAKFDAGILDAQGNERAPEPPFGARGGPWGARPGAHPGAHPGTQGFDFSGNFDDLGDIFAQAFRAGQGQGFGGFGGARGGAGPRPMRGEDLQFHIEVSFLEALLGAKKTLGLPEIGRLEVTIPAGIAEGQVLRLAGKGAPGANGGAAGDAYLRVSVAPDARFAREGDDVVMDLPISIDEAVLGATIEAEIPGGRVRLKVPPMSSSGRMLRLRGKGVPRKGGAGDLRVRLKIVLPETGDAGLTEAIKTWRAAQSYDPRAQ
ncbi:DnaJ C-terminal domain-containing protein [Rhodobacter xanthinilyticus]|uniref:DnaJ C-terminal domain-containing protein n=1 Tax=Rhodobacter xanthinilyticus TaxID=1850250 RepID=UPI0018DBAA91|nr:DnaJ C-terminal domain-containing protein [Rhodobacter xanthinilyticus]